jgi:ribosome-binding factor A
MIIRNVTGDVTAPIRGIIGHGVNCQGVMGSGVAWAIRNKFPKAYEEYKTLCDNTVDKRDLLGTVQLVQITDDLYIANMFTQFTFGGDGKKYASLQAVRDACYFLEQKRRKLILERQQPNIQAMAEAVLEVYTDAEMSPRQRYIPNAPFFAEGDSVVGDKRRRDIIQKLGEIAVNSQDVQTTDDINECIYDLEIFLPKIAAGLGGLEWTAVEAAIETHSGKAPVTIYHHDQK